MQAVVNKQTGLVKQFIADIHPDWTDPEGYHLINADLLPEGWQMEPKPEPEPEKPPEEKLQDVAVEFSGKEDQHAPDPEMVKAVLWTLVHVGILTKEQIAELKILKEK